MTPTTVETKMTDLELLHARRTRGADRRQADHVRKKNFGIETASSRRWIELLSMIAQTATLRRDRHERVSMVRFRELRRVAENAVRFRRIERPPKTQR